MARLTLVERQRRFRQRQQAGIQVVPVEVDQDIVDCLIMARRLKADDAGDVPAIAQAIAKFIAAPPK